MQHSEIRSQALGLRDINAGTWSGSHGWSKHSRGPLIESINPATGKRLAQVRGATAEDYEHVMSAAVAAAAAWRQVPAPKRGEAVRLIGEELRQHKDALGSLVSLENGKIKAEGDGEVQEMIDIADFAVGQVAHAVRPHHAFGAAAAPHVRAVASARRGRRDFRLQFSRSPCGPGMPSSPRSAGNATVWKPSPKTALCSLAVQHICNRVLERHALPADLPDLHRRRHRARAALRRRSARRAGVLHRLDARRAGRSACASPSGSARACSSSAATTPSSSMKAPTSTSRCPAIVFGAVGTAGQRCTTTRRVLVHRSRAAELERRLVAAYAQVRIGDPLDAGTLMGPLIDAGAVSRYSAAIAAAQAAGRRSCCAAARCCRGPAISSNPPSFAPRPDMAVVRTETFAPILYLISLRHAGGGGGACKTRVPYGLSSAVFTDRLQVAERFLSAEGSDCGIANVNLGTSGAEIGGAFGGEKDTGGGREAGSDSWKAYMRRQTNTINWSSQLPLAQGIRFDL